MSNLEPGKHQEHK